MAILEVNNLKKVYTTRFGGAKVQALSNVSFTVEEGEYVAIMGESGSGKTTLLNILAALDRPTSGEVILGGKNLTAIKESQIAEFRRNNLGFVFQDFNLLDNFSVQDNIFLPLVLAGKKYPEMKKLLTPLAEKLEITNLLKKYPYEISGGQKQRTAVARALITRPQLILADEPTGALDSRSSDQLLDVFEAINSGGQTILMVTHSTKAASHAGRVLFIKDGEVFHQIYRGNSTNEELFQKISDTLTVLATSADRRAAARMTGTGGEW
ncbi:MAG: ABC transporter ATP-binding protein [Firmicutes bacterium]|nr:ABC transporter ATP-binding protein [Bacillota bacterium]